MYNLNPLMRSVLITTEEVLYHGPTKQTIDERQIMQHIIIAEERFIRPALGFDFYDALVESKNLTMTSVNLAANQALVGDGLPNLKEGDVVNAYEYLSAVNKDLWKKHLWKLTAECVMAVAFPEGFIQHGTEGVFHNSPPAGLMVSSGQVTPLLTSMKWALDKKLQDRIGPLLESMHNYLCKYVSDFALYSEKCPDCADESTVTKWSGIALNLYDD